MSAPFRHPLLVCLLALGGLACGAGSARASLPVVEALPPDGAVAVPAAPAPVRDAASGVVARVGSAAASPRVAVEGVAQTPGRVVGRARAAADAVTPRAAPRVRVAPRAQAIQARGAVPGGTPRTRRGDGGARAEHGPLADDNAQTERKRVHPALASAGADSGQTAPPTILHGDGAVLADARNGARAILADRVDVARRRLDGVVAAPQALLDRVDGKPDALLACATAAPHGLLDCARDALRDGVTATATALHAPAEQPLPSLPMVPTDGLAGGASPLPGGASEPHLSKRAPAQPVALRVSTATRPIASQLPAATPSLLAPERAPAAPRDPRGAQGDGSAQSPPAAAPGGGPSGSAPCDRAAVLTARPLDAFSTHEAARRLPPPAAVLAADARPG